MRQKLSLLLVPVFAAALANWCVAHCMGLLVVFFAEHKLFGLPISIALFVEEAVVYLPICLCFGLLVGFAIRPKPLLAGALTALVATAIFAIGGYWYYWQHMNFSSAQNLRLILGVFLSPGLWFFILFPLGSYAGSRLHTAA